MCDYSLQAVKSRPAVVGEELITNNFGTGTTGFVGTCDVDEYTAKSNIAVCVLPGTELGFSEPIKLQVAGITLEHGTAIFRQVDKDVPFRHHDMLELPDGRVFPLTNLTPGQKAKVLQLPATPKTDVEREEQRRAEYV